MPDRVAPDRLADVQRITDAAHEHLDLDGLLTALTTGIRAVLGVDEATILLDGAGPSASAGQTDVALRTGGRAIGTLRVGVSGGGRLADGDVPVLQFVADRAATAIENARLFEAERAARREAEANASQLADLQAVTDVTLARLSLDELLNELLARIAVILHVDTAAILLNEPSGDELLVRAAKGLEEEVEAGVRIPVGKGFAGRVAAERRPVAIDVDTYEVYNPLLRKAGVRSLLGVPLLVDGGVLGVLHVGTLTKRDFTAADSAMLELVADRAALAIERARVYEREHAIAETLQRSLLPAQLVELPGVEVAARYVAPAEAADVGGDWYDAIALPDGRIGVAIGDVVGRGLPAAALMGQLRNGLHAYALEGREPHVIAGLLNRIVRDAQPGATATMIYVVYAPDEAAAILVNAGHVPPVVAGPEGGARLLDVQRSVPLGATRNPRYVPERVELEAGATLLLYTDGLVERSDEDLKAGLERLRAAAAAAPVGTCQAMVESLVGRNASADDVAILAFRPLPLPARLHERFPAEPDLVPVMRRLVRRWLADRGVPEEVAYDTIVACSEACANAVEHAYGPSGEAWFEVCAAVDGDGQLELTVADAGGWREPRGEFRGRGLMLMRAFMDSVEVQRSESGTTVVMRRARTVEAVA